MRQEELFKKITVKINIPSLWWLFFIVLSLKFLSHIFFTHFGSSGSFDTDSPISYLLQFTTYTGDNNPLCHHAGHLITIAEGF